MSRYSQTQCLYPIYKSLSQDYKWNHWRVTGWHAWKVSLRNNPEIQLLKLEGPWRIPAFQKQLFRLFSIRPFPMLLILHVLMCPLSHWGFNATKISNWLKWLNLSECLMYNKHLYQYSSKCFGIYLKLYKISILNAKIFWSPWISKSRSSDITILI